MRIVTASIGMPDPYIRKSTNNERINMWVEQIRASAEDLISANPGMNPVEAVEKSYFLPKIHVMEMKDPVTIEFTGSDRKKHTRMVGYRVIDGVHRYLTRQQLGLDNVDAEVHKSMSPGQAYALQFKLNNDGPLPFDRSTRDIAIKTMAKFEVDGKPEYTQEQIATQTGISKGQVSRILAGKSGAKSKEEVSEAKAKGGKAKGKAKSNGGYDAKAFFAAMKSAARECASHSKVLKEYLGSHDAVWEPCEDLMDSLAVLRGVAVELVPVKE